MIQGMNILRLDLLSSQLQRNSIGIYMRNYYSIYIKPPLNPSKKEKSGSEMRRRNQTIERRRNKPTYPGVTGKRNFKTTAKY
jgi:hypothetical protein